MKQLTFTTEQLYVTRLNNSITLHVIIPSIGGVVGMHRSIHVYEGDQIVLHCQTGIVPDIIVTIPAEFPPGGYDGMPIQILKLAQQWNSDSELVEIGDWWIDDITGLAFSAKELRLFLGNLSDYTAEITKYLL